MPTLHQFFPKSYAKGFKLPLGSQGEMWAFMWIILITFIGLVDYTPPGYTPKYRLDDA